MNLEEKRKSGRRGAMEVWLVKRDIEFGAVGKGDEQNVCEKGEYMGRFRGIAYTETSKHKHPRRC